MKILNPEGWYQSPKYWSGVKAGNLITTAGCVAKRPDGSVFAPGDTSRQAEHIMECLKAVLAEGGATLGDVVKATTYYIDNIDWPEIHEIQQHHMGDHYPPHTGIKVENLGSSDIKLEIEMMAVVHSTNADSSKEEMSMKPRSLNPADIYNSPRYYSGIRSGNLIFTAGRTPLDHNGEVVAPNDAATQTEHIMTDLGEILAEGGARLQDVVFVHTYFLHTADMPKIHEVRQRFFGDHYPPHTGTKKVDDDWERRGILVEIEVVAVVTEV